MLYGLLLLLSLSGSPGDSSWWLRQDVRLLRLLNGIEHPVLQACLSAANASSYPVFVGAPVGIWVTGALRGEPALRRAGFRMATAEGVVAGVVLVLKELIGRPRPYKTTPDLQLRSRDRLASSTDAMPSGHAALAFSLATAGVLETRTWTAAFPLYAWAASVALARPYMGLHYPSDVLFGAMLGTGLTWGVYRVWEALSPAPSGRHAAHQFP